MAFYGQDLAYIQAAGFEEMAREAAPEIVRRLKAAPIQIKGVVEVGCGTGPLTSILVKAAFDVTAVDVSEELLRIARERAPGARFVRGSMYEVDIPQCEAVLAIGEPLTYHEADDADQRVYGFFRRVAEVLPVGGILMFDIIELGQPSLTARSWHAGDDWAVLVQTKEEQHSRQLVREIEIFRRVGELYRRGRETHHVRLYETSELCEQLRALGFVTETAQSYGSCGLAPRRRAFFCTRLVTQTRQ